VEDCALDTGLRQLRVLTGLRSLNLRDTPVKVREAYVPTLLSPRRTLSISCDSFKHTSSLSLPLLWPHTRCGSPSNSL
jgi:hypothetical protein